jgi:hypothetical protein
MDWEAFIEKMSSNSRSAQLGGQQNVNTDWRAKSKSSNKTLDFEYRSRSGESTGMSKSDDSRSDESTSETKHSSKSDEAKLNRSRDRSEEVKLRSSDHIRQAVFFFPPFPFFFFFFLFQLYVLTRCRFQRMAPYLMVPDR